jgi:outer membrane lipoprotein-sorting protein
MQPKSKALIAALAGTALGLGGLAAIAMPAGAGEAPQLPPVSPEDLVQSVMTAPTPAFSGEVKVDNNLGLPTPPGMSVPGMPGMNPLSLDNAHVYSDGNGDSRVALKQGNTERTMVHDGPTIWQYNSQNNSATKITVPPEAAKDHHGVADGQVTDPTAAAGQLLSRIRESSTVTVEGTARVADRPAYEMVLTPKPTERTMLREVRVTVDAEKRMPLRLAVLTNGTADPALQIAFDSIDFAPQPADLFHFTPPQGAKVTEKQEGDRPKADPQAEAAKQDVKTVGEGWDTVVTGKIPADALKPQAPSGQGPQGKHGRDGQGMNPMALLGQISKPVSGPFGTGHLITTKVGTALITDDGRFAAGAVPEQVLVDALGAK